MLQINALSLPFTLDDMILADIVRSISSGGLPEYFGVIQIAILDDPTMRELNRSYRGMDSTTDVLSFGYEDNYTVPRDTTVGEIVLSPSLLESQAFERGYTLQEEFYRLVIHGILHILGFDHETDADYASMYAHEYRVISILQKHYHLLEHETPLTHE